MRYYVNVALYIFSLAVSLFSFISTVQAEQIKQKEYKIYLAGPEVFLPNPTEKGMRKHEIIARFNETVLVDESFKFVGQFPMDNEIGDFQHDSKTAMRIFKANLNMMKSSDFVIANMTWFRSPSMDVGTAFEMGFMYALNKPVFGYYSESETYCSSDQVSITSYNCGDKQSDTNITYLDKVKRFANGFFIDTGRDSYERDKFSHEIENFGLSDNLMMIGSVRSKTKSGNGDSIAKSFLAALQQVAVFLKSDLKE